MVLFVVLGAAASLAMAVYAVAVVDEAPSSFDLALLIFTGIAAVVGWLGLLVSFLTYRLEAGRFPRPSVEMRLPDGSAGTTLHLKIQLVDPSADFEDEIARRRGELLERSDAARSSMARAFLGSMYEQRILAYEEEVGEYLDDYRDYLKSKAIWDSIWRRSYVLAFVFTNEKAGVPANGLRAEFHFPDNEDAPRITTYSSLPGPPEEPRPPEVPKPEDVTLVSPYVPTFPVRSVDVPPVRPRGNVSGPSISKGSILVTYDVDELLHNTRETTGDDPVVITFVKPGTWRVPYEIHARNLPQPRQGTLFLEASLAEADVMYEPPPLEADGWE